VAVLRLARWAGDDPLLVSWADLVRGDRRERLVHVAAELPELSARFDEQLAAVRARIAIPDPVPGADCRTCRHVWRCPAHPDGINVTARRGDIRPGVISLTPTAFDAWTRCRRMWRNQYLLSVPASDDSGSPDHGQRAHDVLRFVHDHGTCHDRDHVEGVLEAHGGGDRLRDEIARHAQRCPSPTEALGHELDVARFHKHPWPPFMATARLDAVWIHDGVLDARDYKTGKVWYPRVADDPKALVQAWVLGPAAAARGLRLRLRYEHLAAEIDDDPEPWELDTEDLDEVEERLRAQVEAMQGEGDWNGVAEDTICRTCNYRSICPDSASPGEPLWPAVDDVSELAEPSVAG
jgi:PD-(D/E)XK nuclease superfamily